MLMKYRLFPSFRNGLWRLEGVRLSNYLIISCFVLIVCAELRAQITFKRDYYLGQQRNSQVFSAIEDIEGNIILAGQCNVKDKGTDLQLQVISKKGTILKNFQYGGLKDDVARSVIETKDGGYLIAGFTESVWATSKGERDAILIRLNRQGDVLWDYISGTVGKDEWNQVILLPSGNLLAVGNSAAHPIVSLFTPEGKVLWEKTWGQFSGELSSACISDDQVYYTGKSIDGEKTELLIIKSDLEGIIKKSITLDKYLNGNSIIPLQDGNIAIGGNLISKSSRQDGCVIKLSPLLEVITQKIVGDISDDWLINIIELKSTDLMICGYSYSGSKGARRADLWIELLDKDLNRRQLDKNYFGGSQEDIGYTILELSNHNLWVIGSTYAGLSTGIDTWILEYRQSKLLSDIPNNTIELLTEDSLWISGEDRVPDDGEYGYFSVRLENNSDATSSANKLIVKSTDKNLLVPDSLLYSPIAPGKGKVLIVPFTVKNHLSEERPIIRLVGSTGQEITYALPARTLYSPLVNIQEHLFQTTKNESVLLRVTLHNDGNGFLSQGSVYFVTDFKVKAISADVMQINQFGPNETREIEYQFQPEKNYNEDSVKIRMVIRSDESEVLAEKEYIYHIEKIEPNLTDASALLPKIESTLSSTVAFQTALWLRPDPEESGYKLEHEIPELDVRLKIVSSVPIDPDSLTISINDLLAEPGSVYLPQSVSFVKDQSTSGYQYTYQNKLNLLVGENVIKLVYKSSGKQLTNRALIVDYIPKRFNLHLISIGIPHDDLQFTSKDAADLAKVFESQSGRLFKEVDIHLFNTPENTTTNALRFAIQDIANDYFLRDKIQPGDMIILYISSHGFQVDEIHDEFRIAASDFNWLYKQQTSLDFRSDVINVLSSLPCKKLILLDACYSGAIADIISEDGAKGLVDPGEIALSRAISRLVSSQNAFQVITSSSPGQRSYEDAAWGNSAFMKGVLESMTLESNKNIIDRDGDRVLYLSEIFNYIESRVPEIIMTKKPRPTDIQKPWLLATEEWPIYVYQ